MFGFGSKAEAPKEPTYGKVEERVSDDTMLKMGLLSGDMESVRYVMRGKVRHLCIFGHHIEIDGRGEELTMRVL